MSVRIVTDSTADLPKGLAQELGICVIPLNVHFGNEVFREGTDLSTEEFFHKLARSPALPKTSQPSVGAFQEVYSQLARETSEIVSIHISAKLSGTINSALLARQDLSSDCRIEIVDSMGASMVLGMTVIAAAKAAQAGASLSEILELIQHRIPRTHLLLFVDTLEYLEKGGRIGKAQALLGSLLSVKPLITIREGEVHPVERVRTRQRALERLVQFAEGFPKIEELTLLYSTTPEEAEGLAERIHPIFPKERLCLSLYGPVIGTHVGPGAMGVIAYVGKEGP